MLDFTKPHCLKSQPLLPFTINRTVDEAMLTNNLQIKGVEVGDYMCQWIDKNKIPQVDYYKEHQIKEYIPPATEIYVG
jgi:hypothetical protein